MRNIAATKITGHSGAGALAPPNSLEGFELAYTFGVHRIEFDVCIAENGQPVLAHSAHDITPNSVTLHDALTFLEPTGVALSCDVKTRTDPHVIGDLLARHGVAERTVICGHDRPTLDAVLSRAPGALRGWSVPEPRDAVGLLTVPAPATRAIELGWRELLPHAANLAIKTGTCDGLMVKHDLVTHQLVDAIHDANGFIHVWTIDDEDTAQRIAALGVDEIVSNDPHRIQRAILNTRA